MDPGHAAYSSHDYDAFEGAQVPGEETRPVFQVLSAYTISDDCRKFRVYDNIGEAGMLAVAGVLSSSTFLTDLVIRFACNTRVPNCLPYCNATGASSPLGDRSWDYKCHYHDECSACAQCSEFFAPPKLPPPCNVADWETAVFGALTNNSKSALTTLTIKGALTPTGIGKLGELLKSSRNVTTLTLDSDYPNGESGTSTKGSLLADLVATEVADALRQKNTLVALSLGVASSGASAIAEALKINTGLATLHLENVESTQGAVTAADSAFATSIVEALAVNTALKALDFSDLPGCCKVQGRSGCRANGWGCIGGAHANAFGEALKTNRALMRLGLNALDSAAATPLWRALQVNTGISSLDLRRSGSHVVGGSLATAMEAALKANRVLRTLNLRNLVVGDDGAIALGAALNVNAALVSLDLGGSGVGDSGASALGNALKVNSVLESLDLNRCSIGDVGAAALADGIQVNTALKSLDVYGNPRIRDAGATAIAEALKMNTGPLIDVEVGDGGGGCVVCLGNRGVQDKGILRLIDFLTEAHKNNPGVSPVCNNLGIVMANATATSPAKCDCIDTAGSAIQYSNPETCNGKGLAAPSSGCIVVRVNFVAAFLVPVVVAVATIAAQ